MALLSTDPIDLLLGPDDDLDLTGGDAHLSSGLDGVAQGVRVGMRMIRGELFCNLDAGPPWIARDGVPESQALLGQQYDDAKLKRAMIAVIQASPGIGSVGTVNTSFDAGTRIATVDFEAQAVFGGTVADTLTKET